MFPYFIAGICDNKCQCGISEFFMMRNSKQLNVMWSSWNTHPEQPFWSTRQTEHYQHWSVAADDDHGSEAHSPLQKLSKALQVSATLRSILLSFFTTVFVTLPLHYPCRKSMSFFVVRSFFLISNVFCRPGVKVAWVSSQHTTYLQKACNSA